MNTTQIKKEASKIVKENFKNIWLGLLISFILTLGYNIAFTYYLKDASNLIYYCVSLGYNLITIPLSFGTSKYILSLVRKESYSFKDLFYYYKNHILDALVLSICISICISLGLIAFIIPAVIIFLMFAFAENIFVDGKTNAIDALKASNDLIKGHKWEYFNFLISFIGWLLLGVFTFGLAFIWVYPYITVCQKLYYIELTKK